MYLPEKDKNYLPSLHINTQLMRPAIKVFFIALWFFAGKPCFGQTIQIYNIDSLKRVLSTSLHDTNRILALNNLGRNYQNSDTVLLIAEQAMMLSERIGFKKGEVEAYNNMAYWFNQKGNYPKALEYYLKAIRLAEAVNYRPGLKRSFNSISTVYLYRNDFKTAREYSRKARKLSIEQSDLVTLALASSWLSKSYIALNEKDSALVYAQESYEAALRTRDPFPLYLSTALLGEVHQGEGNYTLALEYLRMSLKNSKTDGRYFRIAAAHQQLAYLFDKLDNKDSSTYHATEAFRISQQQNLTATLFSSSLLLSQLFEDVDDSKSLQYHKLALAAKDSLFSQEKNHQVEELRFNELQRQREAEALSLKMADKRKNNLQYAGIALGLIMLVIVFLLLSHSILATPRLIKFFGILALLIIFEFVNLLIGPFVDSISGHSPVLMLMIMVVVAALLIPLHNRIEHWITNKLIVKNNRIRLAAAKKIISTIEND